MKIVLIIVLSLLGLLLACALFLVIISLCIDPKKTYETDSPFYRRVLNVVTGVGLWLLRVRVHTTGTESVPTDTHCLFVANHRSNFDPLIMWCVFRKRAMAFVSKPSLFRMPVFGRIIRRCRFMPIDRENPRNALKTFSQASDMLKKQEASVGVYPEGTRSKTMELLPFHNGVFRIAQKAQVPVVVMTLRGTQRIAHNIPFRVSHVYLDVEEIIFPEEMEGIRHGVIGERVRHTIEQGLTKEDA